MRGGVKEVRWGSLEERSEFWLRGEGKARQREMSDEGGRRWT